MEKNFENLTYVGIAGLYTEDLKELGYLVVMADIAQMNSNYYFYFGKTGNLILSLPDKEVHEFKVGKGKMCCATFTDSLAQKYYIGAISKEL